MTNPKTLRFHARGTASVPNHDLAEARIRAFVGREIVEARPGQHGFAPTTAPTEVRWRQEYVKYCQEGDLWPADAETAKACGVPFDPTFGGEAVKAESGSAPPVADAAESSPAA